VNLLYTTTSDIQTIESQENIVAWKDKHHIVEFMPLERLTSYLRFDRSSSLALVDAIICSADTDVIAWGSSALNSELNFPLTRALKLAEDVVVLPENCAMRDGRKWKSIPIVILHNTPQYEFAPEVQDNQNAHILLQRSADVTLRKIRDIVDDYHARVLEDYRNVGIMVRFVNGRAQVGPALRKKDPRIESEYYYAPADRRTNTSWVTVKRDSDGVRYDVELFQYLIDTGANETRMHQFFEEHPAFLMDARMGIPISHRPNLVLPADWKPDFAFSPILGPLAENLIELLELKGPLEKTLAREDHRGFSAKVHAAVDQVRDYDRYIRQPQNLEVVEEAFGYVPAKSKLAVLVGRKPITEEDREIFAQRQNELNVKVITYDEILQTQADQMTRLRIPPFERMRIRDTLKS
jgi:hypothetical protein